MQIETASNTAVRALTVGFIVCLVAFDSIAVTQAISRSKTHLAVTIDRAIEEEVDRGFSGAVLVVRGKSRMIDRGYGSIRGIAVRSSARFWIASGAKQFVSASILKCIEQGLLNLSDPILRFFPDAPPDKRAITIEQLLGHLSGLDQSYVSEGLSDRDTAVRRMLSESLIDKAGVKFHYSNSNYQLAVAIVEVVSGRSYQEFVAESLWHPAGLRNTGFSGDAGSRLVLPAIGNKPERLTKSSWGGEGVYSTTHDLLKWYRALRAGRLLSIASANRLFTGLVRIGEGQAGLGWFIGRTEKGATRFFTRGNESFGANGLIYAYPESDTIIIVLSHAGQANDDLSWSRFVHLKIEKLLLL